jgi:hypothetical protein
MLGIGHRIRQTTGILLGQLSCPTLLCKLTLKRAIFQTRLSASSQAEANAAVFSASILNTHSRASLSARWTSLLHL